MRNLSAESSVLGVFDFLPLVFGVLNPNFSKMALVLLLAPVEAGSASESLVGLLDF
jgi:hypothetical protein